MQGPGELAEVELRADALDRAAIGVDVEQRRAAVGITDARGEGEVIFVRAADGLHDQVRLGTIDRFQYLAEAEALCIIGRLAGAHVRVSQPDDLLADRGQGAGDTDDQQEEPDR